MYLPITSPHLRNSLPFENSAGSEAEATPTSSQSSDDYSQSQADSAGFGNSSMEDSEEASEATTSEVLDTAHTSRLKVFDFDDENSLDCAVTKTVLTASTKPRVPVVQTPVRRVRVGRVSRTSGTSAKRSKGTQMTLNSFNLLASTAGKANSSRSPEKGVRSSRGSKGQTNTEPTLRPVKCAAEVHALTRKEEERSAPILKDSAGSRNVAGSKRGLVSKDAAVSKGSPSKNSSRASKGKEAAVSKESPSKKLPLESNRTPVSKEGAKSSPTSSRNAPVRASKGKDTAASKGSPSRNSLESNRTAIISKEGAMNSSTPSRNVTSKGKEAVVSKSSPSPSKRNAPKESLPSQSKNTRVVTRRGGSARRIAFSLKGVFQEEETRPASEDRDDPPVGMGGSLMTASPSTLPDYPVAGVPVGREKLPNKTTKTSSSSFVSLEPYTGPVDLSQPDFSDDPYSFHDHAPFSADTPGSADTGSRLTRQRVLPDSGSEVVKSDFGTKEFGSRTKGESSTSVQVKQDYSRRRPDGASITLSPAKTRTQPEAAIQNADSASDDMLHEIDALLENEGYGGRGLWGGASSSSKSSTSPLTMGSNDIRNSVSLFHKPAM